MASASPASSQDKPSQDKKPDGKVPTTNVMSTLHSMIITPAESKFAEVALFAPVIFTLGSFFISIFTLNYPIFLFAVASGEAMLIQKMLHGVSDYLVTSESIHELKEIGKGSKCKSIYEGSEATKFKYLLEDGVSPTFPNSALYFLSFASAYCIQSMSFFTKEAYERGKSYSVRPYVGYISASLCIILFSIYCLIYSCDTPFGIVLSVLIGLLIGFTLCYQNFLLFGKKGIDMLFIPPILTRTGMDYICVSTN
jgi:hypothetical protein